MTREELLNGYKEDVRDFAKECLHFEGELDATFFDNWAEHFTNLAERLRPSLPEGLEEAAEKYLDDNLVSGVYSDFTKATFIAGAEWGMNQMPLPEDTAIFQMGVAEGKRLMREKAVGGRYMKAYSKVYVESWPLDIDPDSVKAGDEVRLIVIPEEK